MSFDQPALFAASAEPAAASFTPEDFPFFHGAAAMAETGVIDPSWVPTLLPLDHTLRTLARRLSERSLNGEQILPEPRLMLRALQVPVQRVKVLILGQDPYPTPSHPVGLSFSTDRQVRPLPRSLKNIYRELEDDLGVAPVVHGDLSAWQEQGVMLLNQTLSVGAGQAGSHQKLGWDAVTNAVITTLNRRTPAVVAILWGAHAQKLAPAMPAMVQLRSAHPSPLSASRGFFGSQPFSAVNRELQQLGLQPVDWQLPPA